MDRFASPIGPIFVVADGVRICAIDFGDEETRMMPLLRRRFGADVTTREASDPCGACSALAAYFAGDLMAPAALSVEPGGTPFRRRVWAALRDIPPGTTETYGGLAKQLGIPKSARAVGTANGQNPIDIVIPCHRLVGADGSLTGYSGGLDRKRWLLAHEGALAGEKRTPALPF